MTAGLWRVLRSSAFLHKAPSFCWERQNFNAFSSLFCPSLRFFSGHVGQPTHATHPHLFQNPNEIIPHTSAHVFEERRRRLCALLPLDSVAFLSGYGLRYASRNIFYPFRQSSNVVWLGGLLEENVALMLHRTKNGDCKFFVFADESSSTDALWHGRRTTHAAAIEHFGANEAHPTARIAAAVRATGVPPARVFVDADANSTFRLPSELHDAANGTTLDVLLQWLRVVKDESEIAAATSASSKAADAFRMAIRRSVACNTEFEIAAEFAGGVLRAGCDGLAYTPVVGAGSNALVLHYTQNKQRIAPQDAVLMDAGAYFACYNTDVTRTWPVSGRFSEPLAALYSAVLFVQKACIEKCVEVNASSSKSAFSLDKLHTFSVRLLTQELAKLGFPDDPELVQSVLFPHHVGHYLGLDLHDCAEVSRDIPLRKNMIITVEPGVYVPQHDERFPAKYRGIGIRIEDDVVIGAPGAFPTVLSNDVPKEIQDLEALMR